MTKWTVIILDWAERARPASRSRSHPEHVVDEQPRQQQARHLQAGQPHEGDHGHAQAHGQRCGGEADAVRGTTGAGRPSGLPDVPSMRSQWPVRTQISTSKTEREKERSSARVKRPQQPKEILQPETCQCSVYHPTPQQTPGPYPRARLWACTGHQLLLPL